MDLDEYLSDPARAQGIAQAVQDYSVSRYRQNSITAARKAKEQAKLERLADMSIPRGDLALLEGQYIDQHAYQALRNDIRDERQRQYDAVDTEFTNKRNAERAKVAADPGRYNPAYFEHLLDVQQRKRDILDYTTKADKDTQIGHFIRDSFPEQYRERFKPHLNAIYNKAQEAQIAANILQKSLDDMYPALRTNVQKTTFRRGQ